MRVRGCVSVGGGRPAEARVVRLLPFFMTARKPANRQPLEPPPPAHRMEDWKWSLAPLALCCISELILLTWSCVTPLVCACVRVRAALLVLRAAPHVFTHFRHSAHPSESV